MARLPVVGSDEGNWGDVLNTYLLAGHDASGNNIGKIVETSKSANYTLASTDNGTRIVVTSAVTITIPSVGTLANGFECEIVNDSTGNTTLTGPSSSVIMLPGDIASILEVNSKQRVIRGSSIVVS